MLSFHAVAAPGMTRGLQPAGRHRLSLSGRQDGYRENACVPVNSRPTMSDWMVSVPS